MKSRLTMMVVMAAACAAIQLTAMPTEDAQGGYPARLRQRMIRQAGRAVNAAAEQQQATVGGYTWSYRVNNGEATIVAEKDGKYSCAVSPGLTGEVSIPATFWLGRGNIKVTGIGESAFEGCSELTSVMIPKSVTNIGYMAFAECKELESVTIPDSVKRIEWYAFMSCGALTSVTMCGERPKAPDDIFHRCGKLKSIHVPAKAKSWSGMKKWQGIPLVFDGEDGDRRMAAAQRQTAEKARADIEAQEKAERERERVQAAAEREEQRKALLQIQEELRRQREQQRKRQAEEAAAERE